ncbi:catalase [Metasolibacillus sp. FSL H7-0170]|uniref:catalase n=1 Tax=Metasolibacillus sp. FSL H7-0170 TaxID=2921431 RepID=UPI003159067E
MKDNTNDNNENKKLEQLDAYKVNNDGTRMTTNQQVRVSNDEESLKAGLRGPTLMEDFHFREKITHFDHERIPERVVHARGYAAHGEFELYESMSEFTRAHFLQKAGTKTPVFVRFSNVVGSSGSNDTARDVRGFAVKFYTEEGNFDLVGNNIPVFFIQDAIKFPDIIHALKPEPHNEMPQASSAHDTFWDFVTSNQEAAHMVMWIMSDRAIPKNYRMMEGFGVNTFRFVNAAGHSKFIKFHWKPVLGVHSLIWDEAQKIGGADPDFQRRDLWEAIEAGFYPEYELGVQMLDPADEFKYDFDILDATKLWPEELIPVKRIGKLTLNRNVDNVFAETEQVAFHPGNVVPGIDFSNDPLLQGRLFSYLDTQLLRLGGPNFTEIPINRPLCPFHNNQRNGFSRQMINVGQVSYHKNSLADNTPATSTAAEGGYVHFPEKVEGRVIQGRSKSFDDFFSQARLFWNSMSPPEKKHIVDAFSFEVGKVNVRSIRQNVVNMLANIDYTLATTLAERLAVNKPTQQQIDVTASSPALSQQNTIFVPQTLRVAIIIGNQFNAQELEQVMKEFKRYGVRYQIIAETFEPVRAANGQTFEVDATFLTTSPVLYDALYVVGGTAANQAKFNSDMTAFIRQVYQNYKPIGIATTGVPYFNATRAKASEGILFATANPNFSQQFIQNIAKQRFWERDIYI